MPLPYEGKNNHRSKDQGRKAGQHQSVRNHTVTFITAGHELMLSFSILSQLFTKKVEEAHHVRSFHIHIHSTSTSHNTPQAATVIATCARSAVGVLYQLRERRHVQRIDK